MRKHLSIDKTNTVASPNIDRRTIDGFGDEWAAYDQRALSGNALDRFGTKVEQRFSRAEIEAMMLSAGLENIRFSDKEPYWVAIGERVSS